jgi:prepilin-type N-terminal cleavage/methylation domain-containing protein
MSESRIQNPESRILGMKQGRAGFSLIELLVSMAILVVITLMVSRIFQQAGVAWDTGSRKAEKMMTGRAVSDFIARQLSHAVPDTNGAAFAVSSFPLKFFVLDEASAGLPAIRQVSYAAAAELADGITDMQVKTYGDVTYGLPVYGTVTVTVSNNVFQTGFYFMNRERARL